MSIELTNDSQLTEVVPPLTRREAVEEALRCYYCYDAPCTKACPTGIDIPMFIRHIATDDLVGSARTILHSNILGATCARICPTEALCEGSCVRVKDSHAVSIGRLQRVAMDYVMAHEVPTLPRFTDLGSGRVAVIGAGPAGLGAAATLARLGYAVDVYDRHDVAGGLDTYGIVSYREPLNVSLFEVDVVRKLGVTFHLGEVIDAARFRQLREQADAVVVAVGLGRVPKLEIPGEDLPGVYDALDLIEQTKTRPLAEINLGRRVAVIGAGNTAVDAATCARRLGAEEVSILYRRDESAMSAYSYEYEFAKQDGVAYRWWTLPVEILGSSHVEAIRCVRTRVAEGDVSSRQSPLIRVSGSEFLMPVTSVIRAIGQEKEISLWQAIGAEMHDGRVVVDDVTYATSIPGVYAAGDCLGRPGEATVVQAVEDGKRVAHAIHQALARQAS
ncbi:MAG: glutamate synthase [Sulfobacillus acidophilus]|uniref:Glutamate synthase n=1 Tax=Sulfobacillus acidophilus TaxID=53633 RepID=A0A2T2WJQ9_9FIRM|nr:MAG: glutamate synthase [Sulfobacillus acidophilus]